MVSPAGQEQSRQQVMSSLDDVSGFGRAAGGFASPTLLPLIHVHFANVARRRLAINKSRPPDLPASWIL